MLLEKLGDLTADVNRQGVDENGGPLKPAMASATINKLRSTFKEVCENMFSIQTKRREKRRASIEAQVELLEAKSKEAEAFFSTNMSLLSHDLIEAVDAE